MTSTQAVRLVARREILTRMRSKAYLITGVIAILALAGFMIVMKIVGGGATHSTVGVTDRTLAAPMRIAGSALGQHVTVRVVTRDDGEKQVRDGDLDALLIGPSQVVVHKRLDDNLRNSIGVLARQVTLNRQIAASGGDPQRINAAVAGTRVDVRALEPPTAYRTERIAVGVVAGVLIYIALLLYGQGVAQGVVEEKSSRIVELLLTAIRPWQLMLGKVVGIGIAGLGQFVVVGGLAVGVALGTGVASMPASMLTGAAIWGVLWFLLGFLIFAFLFAAAGALVSRQEDVASVVSPIMMMIIVPYVLGVSILPAAPDNGTLALLSVIPFFAPTLMPMRIAMGGVPAWEIALAVPLAVLTIAGLIWLSGRVYRNAVLRAGARVSVRDALRAA